MYLIIYESLSIAFFNPINTIICNVSQVYKNNNMINTILYFYIIKWFSIPKYDFLVSSLSQQTHYIRSSKSKIH